MTEPPSPDTIDLTFDLLSHPDRRRIIAALHRDDDEPVALTEVFDEAAVGIDLRHVHLPKLDSSGFVEWDAQNGEIYPGPQYSATIGLVDELLAWPEMDYSRVGLGED